MSRGNAPVTYIPKFAYVANLASNNVSAFTIDAASGGLTAVAGAPFAAGSGPFGVVTDPAGKFVYVTNGESNNVSAYTVNAGTGALTPVSGSPFAVGSGVQLGTPAVDPSGRFLYVPAFDSNLVFAYQIDATSGALAAITSSPFPAVNEPVSANVDPTGRFLYVANEGGAVSGVCDPSVNPCGLSAYTVDALSGALTQVTGSPFPAGPEPSTVVVDPSGRFAYVANQASNTTFEFAIDAATGALTQTGATTPPPPSSGVGAAVEPSGRFAYITDAVNNKVAAYSIDATTGTLTQITRGFDVLVCSSRPFRAVCLCGESRGRHYGVYAGPCER